MATLSCDPTREIQEIPPSMNWTIKKVVKCLSDVNYRIQSVPGRRRIVVHFDRLKPCHPATRLESTAEQPSVTPHPTLLTPPPVGTSLEIHDDDQLPPPPTQLRRYPACERRAHDHFGT